LFPVPICVIFLLGKVLFPVPILCLIVTRRKFVSLAVKDNLYCVLLGVVTV